MSSHGADITRVVGASHTHNVCVATSPTRCGGVAYIHRLCCHSSPPYMRHPTRPVHVSSSRLNSISCLSSSREQLNMLAKEAHANLKYAHLAERQLAVRRKWTCRRRPRGLGGATGWGWKARWLRGTPRRRPLAWPPRPSTSVGPHTRHSRRALDKLQIFDPDFPLVTIRLEE